MKQIFCINNYIYILDCENIPNMVSLNLSQKKHTLLFGMLPVAGIEREQFGAAE